MIVAVAVTKIKTTFMAHKTEKLEEEKKTKKKIIKRNEMQLKKKAWTGVHVSVSVRII